MGNTHNPEGSVTSELNITRSHCNRCAIETKHRVLTVREIADSEELEDYGEIRWVDSYELLECCGCESVSMRHTYSFEPTRERTTTLYPPQVKRRRPSWFQKPPFGELPDGIVSVMDQVYRALDINSRTLALMGTRTVIDMLLVDKVGDRGTFGEKLDALVENGNIGQRNRQFLESALDAGNAATHRGYQPATADVDAVIDIVENLLQASYHLESLSERLKDATPKRP